MMSYTLVFSSTFLSTKQLLTLTSLWYKLSYSKDRNLEGKKKGNKVRTTKIWGESALGSVLHSQAD